MGSVEFPKDPVASHGNYRITTARAPFPPRKLKPDGFSIIMPTYNRAENLKWAIDSISKQNQCWLPVEIVVVNDGSTDHTARLFEVGFNTPDWMSIKYLETGIDAWTSPANSYNLGFKNARHNYLIHSGADIFRYIEHAKRGRTSLYPWCVVTSREALSRVGFYSEDFRAGAGEDDAFILELATIGIKFCRIPGHAIVNQEHTKQYERDLQWKANTNHNVRVGFQRAAELRRKIAKGEVEKFI
jgi:glycosyltransferase involved in cell wall biosynthesis